MLIGATIMSVVAGVGLAEFAANKIQQASQRSKSDKILSGEIKHTSDAQISRSLFSLRVKKSSEAEDQTFTIGNKSNANHKPASEHQDKISDQDMKRKNMVVREVVESSDDDSDSERPMLRARA